MKLWQFIPLLLLASCAIQPPNPLAAITPPGARTVLMQSNITVPAMRTAIILPKQMVSLTLLLGSGRSDGENVYTCKSGNSFQFLGTFPITNQLSIPVDTNSPTMIEVRSFTNLPKPVVITITNDDGSTFSVTNILNELQRAPIIFVPTNCRSVGLFQTTNGLTLAGWSSGTNLVVQQSADRVTWVDLQMVTNLGQFQIQVDGSQGHRFWRTETTTP